MTTNRLPFVGSGRLQEGGGLVTRKQDFNAHAEGNGFRHDATMIDMNPIIPDINKTTVQDTITEMFSLITSSGTGFLSIGIVDGYIQGDYNVGEGNTQTLSATLNAAFADKRLQSGGIVLLLANTYYLNSTVTVPPGITLMGEMAGTTIVGEMQEVPMFLIDAPTTSLNLATGIPVDIGSDFQAVRIMNLILSDNLDGYALFGQPTMTTVPMVQANISSNLTCENVSFIGRINTGVSPYTKTKAAIGYTGSGVTGTVLKVKNCFMDGLGIGISFTPNNTILDFLTIDKCKARTYGTQNSASQSPQLNSFVVMTDCNLSITNNYFNGAGTYVNTLVYVTSGTNNGTRQIISGNYGQPFSISLGNIFNFVPGSVYLSTIMGNNWGLTTDGDSLPIVLLNNTNSPYTVNPAINKLCIIVNTQFSGMTVLLPALSLVQSGFTLIVKDIAGGGHVITITPSGTDLIENINQSYLIQVPFGCKTLMATSGQWILI